MPTGGVVTGYLIMPPEKLMHLSRSILLDKDHLARYFLRTSFLKNRNETFEKNPTSCLIRYCIINCLAVMNVSAEVLGSHWRSQKSIKGGV